MRVSFPGKMKLGPVLTSTVIMAVIVVVAVLLGAGSPARTASRKLPTARPFTLGALGASGQKISLAAYAGRPVIINFFASWCTPCQKETPLIAKFYAAHHGRVVIIGIDANDQASAALKFVHTQGVRYPVGFDPTASVTTSYGIAALPQTLFLNAKHQIVRHIEGAITSGDLSSWAAAISR